MENFSSYCAHKFKLLTYSTVQMKLVGQEGEIKWNSRFPVNSLSPVFTVATGEIRGIRYPQEGNVFHTWENK